MKINVIEVNRSKRQVSVSIDPSVKRQAKAYAAIHGMTLNRLYEEAVKAFMREDTRQ